MTTRDVTTFLGTISASIAGWVASDYDKISSALLALAGLAFLIWRWRRAARTQLCDKSSCPLRHSPNED